MADIKELMMNLNDSEREQVLKILEEISENGASERLESLMLQDYDEIPVDITTFISNPDYLGASFEGGDAIFPFWKEKLKEMFEDGNKYNEIVLTGAIGLGKSTIAIIGMLYVLYGLLCLKAPQVYYGLPATSKIVLAFFNITLDLSFGVAYTKMQDYLQKSPWFLRHGTVKGNKNKVFCPDKNIEFRVGSKSEHGLGQDIFCLTGDTKILDSNGNETTLSELYNSTTEGLLKILSYNIDDKTAEVKESDIGVVPTRLTNTVYKVTLADGTVISGSENHKVLLADGTYKELRQLNEGDEIFELKKG